MRKFLCEVDHLLCSRRIVLPCRSFLEERIPLLPDGLLDPAAERGEEPVPSRVGHDEPEESGVTLRKVAQIRPRAGPSLQEPLALEIEERTVDGRTAHLEPAHEHLLAREPDSVIVLAEKDLVPQHVEDPPMLGLECRFLHFTLILKTQPLSKNTLPLQEYCGIGIGFPSGVFAWIHEA